MSSPTTGKRAIDATIVDVQTVRVSPTVKPELVVAGARGVHDRSDFLLVRVVTSAGVTGIGEVSATLTWSGEDGATGEYLIRTVLAGAVIGQPIAPVADLERRMDRALAGSPFTKAGLSTALWDAYARTLDVPLAVALGGPLRTEIPVKCSLSGDGDRLRATHRAAVASGFESFKVKIGLDPVADAQRVALARQLCGPHAFIGLDANGGYRRDAARRAVELIRPSAPAFLEQPVEPGDLEGMRQLRDLGLPIVADESVFGTDDLVSVLRAEAADVVSLYIGKSGGPGRLVSMARLADAFGLTVVIGSNGELGVGAAAQLQAGAAAAGLSTHIPSDIIGAHYYQDDVLAEPLTVDGRTARLPDGPGLAVSLREDIETRFVSVSDDQGHRFDADPVGADTAQASRRTDNPYP
ncbi:enolase C-terminal domain-like protein [Dactylosporangium sp. NPDC000555]|uniref:mandelate racemase/muconate lactonizing enzyme family protein n=1 Tax=Dactylosporangium sp. NPDC000555 TaxID=3154260 RepID=UPI003323486C